MSISIWTNIKRAVRRPVLASALALAVAAGSFGAYEVVRPQDAHAATAAAPAAALDADSVSALLSLDQAMERLTSRVTPAVVNITVTSRSKVQNAMGDDSEMQRFFGQFFGPQMPRQFRQAPREQIEHVGGSGVVISPDGYIVTNNHVVEGATDIRVTTSDKRVLSAKLVGTDPLTDLAVIKVNQSNMPSIPWGDSKTLKPGQTVLAFGSPLGMRFSVTRGIVSALNRSNPYSDNPRKPGQFIQTDAAVNQGNSGGPLVDARGEVVGINTFLLSPSGAFAGMAFAIPSQIAKPTVDELIRNGKVEHAYVGIGFTDVTPENATFFHLSDATGALVSQVEPDSPASRAGLRVGDVIKKVNGAPVEGAGALQVAVGENRPGTKIELSVVRDGKTMTIPVTVGSYDKQGKANATETAGHGKARWGIGISDLTPDVREQLDVPSNVKGAVVGQVEPGSPADNAGLSEGDVIMQVNRKDTPTSADVKSALSSIPSGQDALVLIWTRGGNSFRVMHATQASGN